VASHGNSILISLSAALLGVLGGAASTGLLVPDAAAQVSQPAARRRDEERDHDDLLLVVPPRDEGPTLLAAHRSHRSHSSHRSHYSGSRSHRNHYSGGSSAYVPDSTPAPAEVAPRPPKPALVSFVAYPGGQISVDGRPVGSDATRPLKLAVGMHSVHIENRFLGNTTIEVEITEGQTGVIEVRW
jgi:hypothetical protein